MNRVMPLTVITLLVLVLLGGGFVPEQPTDFASALRPPGPGGLAGTDHYGRDLLLTVWAAAGGSALAALVTAVLTTLIGGVVGLVSTLSHLLSRLSTFALVATVTLPSMLVIFVVVGILGGGREAIMVTVALTHWPIAAQLIGPRMSEEWAAGWTRFDRRLGAGVLETIAWHVLPAVKGRAMTAMTIVFPSAVVHEATTAFLGIGVDPAEVSLGPLIAWGRADTAVGAWWTLVVPVCALMLLLLPPTVFSRRLGERPRAL